jgi:hypothetical protein
MFVKNNRGTSLFGDRFISYDRYDIYLTNTLYPRSERLSVIKVRAYYIYVCKDVKIRDYFPKPKGAASKKVWETML